METKYFINVQTSKRGSINEVGGKNKFFVANYFKMFGNRMESEIFRTYDEAYKFLKKEGYCLAENLKEELYEEIELAVRENAEERDIVDAYWGNICFFPESYAGLIDVEFDVLWAERDEDRETNYRETHYLVQVTKIWRWEKGDKVALIFDRERLEIRGEY